MSEQPPQQSSRQAKKILIVEDEQDIREALVDKFSREGFAVFEARNGEEGLARAFTEHPDLILLDIVMPVMDGITALNKLREDEWGKHVPVILLTNLNDDEKVANAMEKGAFGYLVKSDWKIEDVVTKVKARLAAS